jgi:hypothetical protein
LKRAKLAQQQAPATTAPALQLRQLEPAPAPSSWRVPGLVLPLAMAAVALFGLLFVWQLSQRSDSPNLVAAKSPTAAPAPAPAAPATAAPVAPQVVVQQTPPAQPVPSASPTPAVPETSATSDAPKDAAPSAMLTVADAPPAGPPPLKLQAIIFNPRRPSALISGRIAFLGDKFGDLRVVGITRTSATLAGAGQTKVLSLPE